MEYLEYKAAKSDYTPDVRRMRAALASAGYMASENDIERLWDDYSSSRRSSWIDPPRENAELLKILFVGFGIDAVPDDDDSYLWPSHWAKGE